MKLTKRSSQTLRDAVGYIQNENWDAWDRTKWLLTEQEFQRLQDEYGDIVY